MKCLNEVCPLEAMPGRNYCQKHAPPDIFIHRSTPIVTGEPTTFERAFSGSSSLEKLQHEIVAFEGYAGLVLTRIEKGVRNGEKVNIAEFSEPTIRMMGGETTLIAPSDIDSLARKWAVKAFFVMKASIYVENNETEVFVFR